ncbi:hypothetical protein [Azorhizophilus paspali]|uniref:Uncharacterized protein n=2 Tax=Azorhizophilus paspali TaxID=69963 RepID=A0ABV6SHR9_AZOPA
MRFLTTIADKDYAIVRSMYRIAGYPDYAELIGDRNAGGYLQTRRRYGVARPRLEQAFRRHPITDAFVVHHGALGSFVHIWSRGNVSVPAIIERIAALEGVDLSLDKATACRLFDLPEDREADVAVIARKGVCIGGSARLYDLSGLKGHRLRTHGGLTETRVPFVLNRPLNIEYR